MEPDLKDICRSLLSSEEQKECSRKKSGPADVGEVPHTGGMQPVFY